MFHIAGIRRSLAVCFAAAGLLAVSASSAAAAVHWSDPTHGMKVSGSLTVYRNGGEAKTCTTQPIGESFLEGSFFYASTLGLGYVRLNCPSSTLLGISFFGEGVAAAGGGYELVFGSPEPMPSPWLGPYSFIYGEGGAPKAKFTNGNATTPSKVTFSSTYLGVLKDLTKVTATGSLNVTTSTGGLLTLQP